MSKIFDLDSPLMQFLTAVANLLIIEMLTLVCCIPIFTIGAALSAMHYMLLKIARHEEGYIVRGYFHSFRDNFKQATGEWLLFFVVFFILGTELYMMMRLPDQFPQWLRVAIAAALILVFLVFQWVFPLQMHFVNTVRQTLKNAIMMAIGNFPRTILMGLVWAIPVVTIVLGQWRVLPIVLMFGLTFPGWLMAKIYSPVFKEFEPEETEPAPDEDFTLEGMQETQKQLEETVSASSNPAVVSREEDPNHGDPSDVH